MGDLVSDLIDAVTRLWEVGGDKDKVSAYRSIEKARTSLNKKEGALRRHMEGQDSELASLRAKVSELEESLRLEEKLSDCTQKSFSEVCQERDNLREKLERLVGDTDERQAKRQRRS